MQAIICSIFVLNALKHKKGRKNSFYWIAIKVFFTEIQFLFLFLFFLVFNASFVSSYPLLTLPEIENNIMSSWDCII